MNGISVIAVGSELLSGEVSDTNTAQIARLLRQEGFRLSDSLAVPDVESDIAAALKSRTGVRSEVIVTGGLGPTGDDLTARSAAAAFGRQLALNDEALRLIQAFFSHRGRPMHPANEKQALLPQKGVILPNREGSAPGFLIDHGGTAFYFLPGVPSEMTAMLGQEVLPRLLQRAGRQTVGMQRVFKVFGLPEAQIDDQLRRAALPEGVELAYRLEFPLVLVKLSVRQEDDEELLDKAELLLRKTLGEHLVAIGDGTLPETVVHLLQGWSRTLSVAESCSGGLISELLTDVPGASEVFDRGAVTYSNIAKRNWLGVSDSLLESDGAVSSECARAMVEGMRRTARTDLSIAVTGIAGPGGGTADKPVGTVYIALAGEGIDEVKHYHFGGDRQRVRTLTAYTALDRLRKHLLQQMQG